MLKKRFIHATIHVTSPVNFDIALTNHALRAQPTDCFPELTVGF